MTKRQVYLFLLVITSLAIGLRFWSIGWGLPYAFHSDEQHYLPRAITMLQTGDLNPHYFQNPPLFTYLLMLELFSYLQLGQFLGFFHSAADLKAQFDLAPAPLYLIARMNSVLFGTATVLLTYSVAKRLIDTETGLLSALLIGVSFLHVRDSHYAVNDVAATFLLMVVFYFSTKVYTQGKLVDYLLGGAFLGLAVATKYNVGLGCIALAAAHLVRKDNLNSKLTTHANLAASAVTVTLFFILANPFSLIDFESFKQEFATQLGWAADPYNTADISISLTILRTLLIGLGPGVLAVSLLGLIALLFQRPRVCLLLLSFPASYLAFFLSRSDLFFARFAIPVLPFICILAAYGVLCLLRSIRPGTVKAVVFIVAALLLVFPPLLLDIRHNTLLRAEDTRLLLGRWVENNIPPGSKIAVEGYSYVDSQGRWLGPKKIPYDMTILSSLRHYTAEYYEREGFDFVIVSSYVYDRYLLNADAHRGATQFYQQIDGRWPLAASFFPTADGREVDFVMDEEITPLYTLFDRDRPGPIVKVYRLCEPLQYGVVWSDASIPTDQSVGERQTVQVTVLNSGNVAWPCDGYNPVRIVYRWFDASGQEDLGGDQRVTLPHQVQPGGQAAVQLELSAPDRPGSYTLRIDLVQENFAWFSALGAEGKEIAIVVR